MLARFLSLHDGGLIRVEHRAAVLLRREVEGDGCVRGPRIDAREEPALAKYGARIAALERLEDVGEDALEAS